MNDQLQGLFSAIREACAPRTWSRGIELQRNDSVDALGDGDPLELRVRSPGRTVAPTVTLYLADEEWGCSCDSTDDPCEHVAAAILALRQARKEGRALATSKKAGADVGYRLARDGERIVVARVAVLAGAEQRLDVSLAGILSGREAGPQIEATQIDLTVDQFLQQNRVRSLPADRFALLLPLLAQARDVRFEGDTVTVSDEPLWPQVIVDRESRSYLLRFLCPSGDYQVVAPGLVLVRAERLWLRPIGASDIVGLRLERLPCEKRYEGERLAELVTTVLPLWRERTKIEERAQLPASHGELVVRPLIDVAQHGAVLRLCAAVAYGDPPRARVVGERLIRVAGAAPVIIERNLRAEQRATELLRAAFDLVPGKAVELSGRDAVTMAAKLRAAREIAILGDAHEAHYPAELCPSVRIDGDRFELSFGGVADGRERVADVASVMEAWQDDAGVVPLVGGGWAAIPSDWLARHGHRIRELLAARHGDRVAPYARPALARLCSDLDQPVPPELERLLPLLPGFTTIPSAPLAADVVATLRPYQRTGVDWLCFLRDAGLGALLADDMGLGKTLQTLCALGGRTLVVCPRSVVHNWVDEVRRFRPRAKVSVFHGAERELAKDGIVVTTYALLRRDIDLFAATRFTAVVLDEAQAIKNPDSQVAAAAFRLQAEFRVALSGTPVENRLEELWSLMHFCNPGLLGGRATFLDEYERAIASGDRGAGARLRERIRPFLLRRTKAEVATDLPPRSEALLACELEPSEREVYDAIYLATKSSIVAELEHGGNVMKALEALLRLRQAACDVALVPGHGGRSEPSSKIQRLMLALEQAAALGHKALVFSQWTSLLDRVEPELAARGIAWSRLDGSTTDRAGVVSAFQGHDGPPVMLLSLKAGGTGLNLTAADHVFLLDPWWNPAAEDQAADRAHRIGQQRPVIVYRIVAKDTVEERIIDLQQKKRALAGVALDDGAAAVAITREDLLALFQ